MIELTETGKIIKNQWNEIPNRFESVSLDEFIVMPNHVHGIVMINRRADARPAPTLGDIVCSFKSKCNNKYLKHIESNNLMQQPAAPGRLPGGRAETLDGPSGPKKKCVFHRNTGVLRKIKGGYTQ